MKGFIKVDKNTAYSIWVNISHIVYLYDERIVLSNGEIKTVKESASEMLSDIEAGEEKREQKKVCGNCKWCYEGHYEEEGEEPCIKRKCLNKYGLTKGYSVYIDDFCSRWEEKEQ